MCKGDTASRNMKRNPTLIDERVLDFKPIIVDNYISEIPECCSKIS